MRSDEQNAEFIAVPKETFKCMISDFEHLLDDFESITEVETMKLAEKRLSEFKSGKAKTVGMAEFKKFIKSEGIK